MSHRIERHPAVLDLTNDLRAFACEADHNSVWRSSCLCISMDDDVRNYLGQTQVHVRSQPRRKMMSFDEFRDPQAQTFELLQPGLQDDM